MPKLSEILPEQTVEIKYENYKGIVSVRKIRPISIDFKYSKWHELDQWILLAYCFERKELREFAVQDIQSWKVINHSS